MSELRFVKYNRTRQEKFQIKTQILEENGTRFVEKTALCEEGIPHIRSFDEKYNLLTSQNGSMKLVKPEVSEDGWTARFDYLQGRTMAEILGEELASGDIVAAVKRGMELLYDIKPEFISDFHVTPEFKEVFASAGEPVEVEEKGPAYAASNIDALFENMLVT